MSRRGASCQSERSELLVLIVCLCAELFPLVNLPSCPLWVPSLSLFLYPFSCPIVCVSLAEGGRKKHFVCVVVCVCLGGGGVGGQRIVSAVEKWHLRTRVT